MAKKITAREPCAFCGKQPCACSSLTDRRKMIRKEVKSDDPVRQDEPGAREAE